MAEAHYITMAPRSGSLGPVAEFAAIHVTARIPNALLLKKLELDWAGRNTAITPSPTLVDGHLLVPDLPGLGVDIVEDEIGRYPSQMNIIVDPGGDHREPGTIGEAPRFPDPDAAFQPAPDELKRRPCP